MMIKHTQYHNIPRSLSQADTILLSVFLSAFAIFIVLCLFEELMKKNPSLILLKIFGRILFLGCYFFIWSIAFFKIVFIRQYPYLISLLFPGLYLAPMYYWISLKVLVPWKKEPVTVFELLTTLTMLVAIVVAIFCPLFFI